MSRAAAVGVAAALLAAGVLGGLLPVRASAAIATTTACDTAPAPPSGSVAVFPSPGTTTANPKTQLTFRGIPLSKIGSITVQGSQSGKHTGTWKADSDGQGASFYPAKAFAPGETVTVRTGLSIAGGTSGTWSFTVAVPASDAPDNGVSYTTSGSSVRHYQTTPIAPAAVTVTDATGSTPSSGDIFLATKPSGGQGAGEPGPMILTSSGRLAWFRALGGKTEAFDFRTQTYRGHPVLTWFQGNPAAGHGRGYDVIENDKYRTIATVHAGNGYTADLHEFQLTPENTALITTYQPVHWTASGYSGVVLDAIVQEIDIPTGNVLFEWHALDHVPLTASYAPTTTKAYDYFHVNSADLDSRDQGVLISARNTDAEYFVSHYTGAIQWQIGGKSSTMGSAVRTVGQHDAKWLSPNRISIFDDGTGIAPSPEPHSRGLVVALDCATHQATLAATFSAPGRPVGSQGSMQLLGNGDAFLGMGALPTFYELSPGGTAVLTGTLPHYDQSYRVYDEPWNGYPTTRPAVKATSSGGALTVYVSWNGATAVTKWRLRGGATSNTSGWTASFTMAKTNYEDAITPSWTAHYVQVQALNSAGKVIGTSAVTEVP